MIEAFTGLPGMGKTYNMTRMALKQMKRGRKVYANFRIKGAEYFNELNEIVGVKDALILIDEAGIYLPAQAWDKIPFEFIRQLRQHRHDGLDLWYTAQDMQDVTTYLRRITQFQRDFTRIWKICYETTTCPSNKKKYGFNITFVNKKVYDFYDTTENIELADYLKEDNLKEDIKKINKKKGKKEISEISDSIKNFKINA